MHAGKLCYIDIISKYILKVGVRGQSHENTRKSVIIFLNTITILPLASNFSTILLLSLCAFK